MSLPWPRRGRRAAIDDARRALGRGQATTVACRLRRTSARGWGPWTAATLVLGPVPGGEARWRADDPIAVGFPVTRGPVDLAFDEVNDVWLRDVRFQTEAFYDKKAEIVVVQAERGTIEVAVPAADAGPVADRLHALLLDP